VSARGSDEEEKKSQEDHKKMAGMIQQHIENTKHTILTGADLVISDKASQWARERVVTLLSSLTIPPKIQSLLLDKLAAEAEKIGLNPRQTFSLLYHEAMARSQPTVPVLSLYTRMQAATEALSGDNKAIAERRVDEPVLKFPTSDKELLREMLLKSLGHMTPLGEGARLGGAEGQAQGAYNRLLADESKTIEKLKNDLNDPKVLGDPKRLDEVLDRAWNFLQDINATYEFMTRGYGAYPQEQKEKEEHYLLQMACVFSPAAKEMRMNLQGASLKMAPVQPAPYMILDRNAHGLVGIPVKLNGSKESAAPLKPGTYSFVITLDAPNEIRIGNGHSAISGQAAEVLFAGELHVEIKKSEKEVSATSASEAPPIVIQTWTNDSGHYGTDPSMLFQVIGAAKDSSGAILLDPKTYAERGKMKFGL
jgi:hypothetical protein